MALLMDRIARLDSDLGAFVTVGSPPILARSTCSEQAPGHGRLEGLVVGVKDNIDVRGLPTRAHSRVEPEEPRSASATVVDRMLGQGAAVVGKTSTMEYAIGAPDLSGPFPVPLNPWDRGTWAGGSSSGSASAVAAGFVDAALGTDTGGSIRMPAAFCGVVGLKPTFGLVPNTGSRPLARTADTIGPIALSVRDCAHLLSAIAGPDEKDPVTVGQSARDYARDIDGGAGRLVVGVCRPPAAEQTPGLQEAWDEALECLADIGCQLVEVQLPHYARALNAHRVTLRCEALAEHRRGLAAHLGKYSAGFRESVLPGVLYNAADYLAAQRARAAAAAAAAEMFRTVDVVVTPTASITAIPIERVSPGFERHMRSIHTGYWNTIGTCALSLPMRPAADGLPLGLQIAGPRFGETALLRLGHAFQLASDYHHHRPADFQH